MRIIHFPVEYMNIVIYVIFYEFTTLVIHVQSHTSTHDA